MSSTTYTPNPASAAARVLAFLQANPSEELSGADVAEKFDLRRNNVPASLSTAVRHGALTWSRNDDLTFVYRLGAGKPVDAENKPASPFDVLSQLGANRPSQRLSKPIAAATNAAAPPTAEAFAALVVEDGIPVDKPKPTPELVWAPLFEKLQQPGQSIQIPDVWRASLAREVRRRNAINSTCNQFKVGKDHASPHARIWRTA